MLPKNRRIPKKEFGHILKNGGRLYSPTFTVYIEKIPKKDQSKFSFSVSKKVCKKAVKRNLYRRRGYASLASIIKEVKPGFFGFFVYNKPKNGELNVQFDQIKQEVVGLLSKAGVIG